MKEYNTQIIIHTVNQKGKGENISFQALIEALIQGMLSHPQKITYRLRTLVLASTPVLRQYNN